YADDVNFHADTLPNEPKRTHLYHLQSLIAQYADVMVSQPAQAFSPLPLLWFNTSCDCFQNGTLQVAFVYVDQSGSGARTLAFLENSASSDILIVYGGRNYTMPPFSVFLVAASSGQVLYA